MENSQIEEMESKISDRRTRRNRREEEEEKEEMENSEISEEEKEEEWKILEITLISAQGLKIPPSAMMRRMYTYALAWVDPTAKLRSHVDRVGGRNPTWNEKFIFRVSQSFISGDTSAVQFQIYAAGYITDYSIGAVRYLLSTTSSVTTGVPTFSALHIRRPSGNIHGVLNIAAAVYDGSRFPSLTGRTSAVCFRDLIGKGCKSSAGDMFADRRFSRCISRAGSKKSEKSSSEAESLDLSVEEFSDGSGTDSTASTASSATVTASTASSATVTAVKVAVKGGNGVRSGTEVVQVAGKKDGRSDGGGGGLLCGLGLQRRSGPLDQKLPSVKKD